MKEDARNDYPRIRKTSGIGRWILWFFLLFSLFLPAGCADFISFLTTPQNARKTVSMPAGSDWDSVAAAVKVPPENFFTRRVVRLTKWVKKNPELFLPNLVRALTRGIKDPFLRVKAIHDWITDNIAYDFSAYLGKSPTIVDTYGVIQNGSSVCQGYAQLFTTMCDLAEIRSRIVSGYSRGYGWDPFAESPDSLKSNHAWNAVEIRKKWYLIDCTWDAGYIDGSQNYKQDYETGYFCARPKVFLSEHYPEDPRWQLLDPPLSQSQFQALPAMKGLYGELGIEIVSALKAVNTVGDKAEFVLKIPDGVYMEGYMMEIGGSSNPFGTQLYQHPVDRGQEFIYLFPEPGRYFLSMTAGRIKPDGSRELFRPAFSVYFVAEKGSHLVFPSMNSAFKSKGYHVEFPTIPYNPAVEKDTIVIIDGGNTEGDLDFFLMKGKGAGSKLVDKRVKVERDGRTWTAVISFPEPGDYTLAAGEKVYISKNTYEIHPFAWFPFTFR